MSETIVNQLKKLIVEELEVNRKLEEMEEDLSLFEEGGLELDSIGIVELISLIEKKFDVDFDESELNPESFSTIKVLADFISQKREKVSAVGG